MTLHYDNCWWDNRAKRYGDATLHILESAIILDGKAYSDEEGSQQLLPLSSFTWNRVFLNSCQADNLKLLDVGMYFSLEHSAAKRLYRFLDKRFYKGPHWVFDLAEIAFERVGLSRNYSRNVAKIKEKLQPAVEELEDIGFLEPLRPRRPVFQGCRRLEDTPEQAAARQQPPCPAGRGGRAARPGPPAGRARRQPDQGRGALRQLPGGAPPRENRHLRLAGAQRRPANPSKSRRLASQGHRGRLHGAQGI